MIAQAIGGNLDYAVMICYFVAVLGFGLYFGRYTTTTKDFFFGGQRFSWWLIAFSCVATVVGSYSFIKYSAAGRASSVASSERLHGDEKLVCSMLETAGITSPLASRHTVLEERHEEN